MKKSVSFPNLVTTPKNAIPCPIDLTHQTSSTTKNTYTTMPSLPKLTLFNVNQDTQLEFISFLLAEDVQSVDMICHYFLDMLLAVGSSKSPQIQNFVGGEEYYLVAYEK